METKLSEILAWSEMAATRHWDTQRMSYLLNLVERLGKALEICSADADCGYKEARELLKELEQ